MKSSAKKIELASVDDLFSTEESRQDEQLEKIQEIPLSELHPDVYKRQLAHCSNASNLLVSLPDWKPKCLNNSNCAF